jgi:hypothetical protein
LIGLRLAAVVLEIHYLFGPGVTVNAMGTLLALKYKPKRFRELAQIVEVKA